MVYYRVFKKPDVSYFAFWKGIARETRINILASTGIYTYDEIPRIFREKSVDFMSEAFIHDLEIGISGSGTKAAILKAATDTPGITPGVEKVLRAVSRAHKATGRPIITHSYPGNRSGADQIKIFEQEDVELNQVVIGHTGDTDNLDYIREILDKGVFVGLDRYGIDVGVGTGKRNAVVVELCKSGYAGQILLSHDASCTNDKFSAEQLLNLPKTRTLSFIPGSIIPELKKMGVSEADLHTIFFKNPVRLFDG